jgi:hypothetical protein
MHERQVNGDEERVSGSINDLVGQSAPEQAQLPLVQLNRAAAHAVFEPAAEHVIDFDLGMPMRNQHDAGLLVADDERIRDPFDLAF